MGWQREDAPGHEGYVVGLVHRRRKDGTEAEGLYRELCYPGDEDRCEVVRLQAGCDCGWRSPHWLPWGMSTARWVPYMVDRHDRDDERALALWQAHVAPAPAPRCSKCGGARGYPNRTTHHDAPPPCRCLS